MYALHAQAIRLSLLFFFFSQSDKQAQDQMISKQIKPSKVYPINYQACREHTLIVDVNAIRHRDFGVEYQKKKPFPCFQETRWMVLYVRKRLRCSKDRFWMGWEFASLMYGSFP